MEKEHLVFASAPNTLALKAHASMSTVPFCQLATIYAFRGDRTTAFRRSLFGAIDAERNGSGPGPTETECLLFAGHTGVSIDGGGVIYGFNPDRGSDPIWLLMDRLRNGDEYRGVVRDDAAVFTAARQHIWNPLMVLSFDVALPPASFRTLKRRLTYERKISKYTYSFPNGNGDCNCTTWIERLGMPLLTGRMDEFTAITGVAAQSSRRFGLCI